MYDDEEDEEIINLEKYHQPLKTDNENKESMKKSQKKKGKKKKMELISKINKSLTYYQFFKNNKETLVLPVVGRKTLCTQINTRANANSTEGCHCPRQRKNSVFGRPKKQFI